MYFTHKILVPADDNYKTYATNPAFFLQPKFPMMDNGHKEELYL